MIHRFTDKLPVLGDRVFIAPGAHVIGDVELGDEVSIWFNTVVRGDVHYIRIGHRTNIQDNSVIHVTSKRNPTIIEHDVTAGHRVLLHGCTIRHHTLIGMGAVVMDRAEVGEYSIVGAGALVTEGTVIPPGTLALGAPAKPRRDITDEERRHIDYLAPHYMKLAGVYLGD